MDTKELVKQIFLRLGKKKKLILFGAFIFSILAFFYGRSIRRVYTSKATVFPLTTPNDNQLTNATLSGILGLGDAPKSFSNEATINIIELALSRNVREAVACTRLPEFNNNTITDLLVKDQNDHKPILGSEIKVPADSLKSAIMGGEMLKANVAAKMSKNGVLELYYSGTNEELITPVSIAFIDKISKFYIDLKRQKAIADYNFTLGKIDSFQNMINTVDRQAINIQRTTLFTPNDLLEYNLPKENIVSEKVRIQRQRDMSINNRDEAVWRLQKATPIISVLDKPLPPFSVKQTSAFIYAMAGFIIGTLLMAVFVLSRLLFNYVKDEIYKSIFGE